MSGGEKQKIAFASVYAMNPKIYLLDEPSSNLDMTSIQELKEHLRLIKSQGKTILIAEHRLYYLMELADRYCLSGKRANQKNFIRRRNFASCQKPSVNTWGCGR